MIAPQRDSVFGSAIAELYERHLVPLLFEPYAASTARHVASLNGRCMLETAAGTGVVTRALAAALPESVSITATDLNPTMLAQASRVGTRRPVSWQQADAMHLPFADESFDTVVCQFGAMFFPDKTAAFAESRRVLRRGGTFVFAVWDRIEDNEFADTVNSALVDVFPSDPPTFMRRTPHGYFDGEQITSDLRRAGFTGTVLLRTEAARSRAPSSMVPAVAFCQGTPIRNEIEARDAALLKQATLVAKAALERRFGEGPIDGKMQAHLISVEK
jgi:SAM-dependent methyltransferase